MRTVINMVTSQKRNVVGNCRKDIVAVLVALAVSSWRFLLARLTGSTTRLAPAYALCHRHPAAGGRRTRRRGPGTSRAR